MNIRWWKCMHWFGISYTHWKFTNSRVSEDFCKHSGIVPPEQNAICFSFCQFTKTTFWSKWTENLSRSTFFLISALKEEEKGKLCSLWTVGPWSTCANSETESVLAKGSSCLEWFTFDESTWSDENYPRCEFVSPRSWWENWGEMSYLACQNWVILPRTQNRTLKSSEQLHRASRALKRSELKSSELESSELESTP